MVFKWHPVWVLLEMSYRSPQVIRSGFVQAAYLGTQLARQMINSANLGPRERMRFSVWLLRLQMPSPFANYVQREAISNAIDVGDRNLGKFPKL